MLKFELRIDGLAGVRHLAQRLSGPEMRDASAKALTDTAFQGQRAMRAELASVFDRPTPFIAKSPKVVPATPDQLSAAIIPTLDSRGVWSPGGKTGVDPQHILRAQERGGRRADKRSEVALRKAGILPAGYQTAIPRDPYPGSDDGRGNLRGAYVAQLISYLQASSEQGYRANMGKKRIDGLRNKQSIGNIAARREFKTTLGVRYFVAHGRLRGGRSGHFAPGVWAASGTHEVDVRPVLLFVRAGSYAPRLNMDRLAKQAGLSDYLAKRMRYRIRQAAGV